MNIYQIPLPENNKRLIDSLDVDRLLNKLFDLGYELGIKIITCIIVYYIGRIIIKWLEKLIKRVLDKKKIDQSVKTFLDNLVNITLTILLVMVIISILGIQTTSFAALIASAGLAVGMAMKDNLANFAGGVMILFNKPIKIGDYIAIQNQEGTVKAIGILYTILTTSDNKTIYIPNGPLSTGNILNYSSQKERRVDIVIGLAYGTPIEKAKKVIFEIINSNALILKKPEPFIGLIKLNNYTLDFTIRVWTKTTNYWPVYFHLNEKLYEKLTENNINIPYPHMTVHLTNQSELH